MGIELVKAVVGTPSTSRLGKNAYMVLTAMAVQALDKPKDGRPGGLYFGGWAALQITLGYEPGGPKSAGHTAVKRAVAELRKAKHITPMVTAVRGTRQSYLVHPGGLGSPVDDSKERGSETDPKWGSETDPKRGSLSDLKGGRKPTLLGHIEEEGRLTEDEIDPVPASTTDRAHDPKHQPDSTQIEHHPHRGGIDDPCADCGYSKLNIVHARHRHIA